MNNLEQLFFVSLIMSIFIFIILMHRKVRGVKFSRKAYYFIWIIIAIRLILPFDIAVKKPIYNLNAPVENYIYKDINQENGSLIVKTEKLVTFVMDNLWSIWLAGASLYLLYNLLVYISFKSKIMRNLSNIDNNIRVKFNKLRSVIAPNSKVDIRTSNVVDSPMIIGLVKPILIMSKDIKFQDIDFILKHELIHLKRKDIFYKLVIFLASALHWFNPVVHIMGKTAREDLELLCDEEVVKGMCELDKVRYSKALLQAISKHKAPIYTTNFSSGKRMMKKRLDGILDDIKKKSGKPVIMIFLISIFSISFFVSYGNYEPIRITKIQTFVNSDYIQPKIEYIDEKHQETLYEYYREMKNQRWYVTYKGTLE